MLAGPLIGVEKAGVVGERTNGLGGVHLMSKASQKKEDQEKNDGNCSRGW